MTERVEKLLVFLHATRDGQMSEDEQLDRLLGDLDDMLDIASLGALSRVFYKQDPAHTPHAEECNSLLEQVDVCRLSTQMVVSLVRFTCSKQSLLPAWGKLCELAVREVKVREPSTWEALMTGLYDREAPP